MALKYKKHLNSSEEEDSLSEGNERCSEKSFNKIVRSKWSPEESKMLNTYSYDKEPVKAWLQINDYLVIKECNAVMWSKISQRLGKFHGYNSLDLYRNSKSNLLNLIEKIICKEKCYYLPEKYFFNHGFELQKLMKKFT